MSLYSYDKTNGVVGSKFVTSVVNEAMVGDSVEGVNGVLSIVELEINV